MTTRWQQVAAGLVNADMDEIAAALEQAHDQGRDQALHETAEIALLSMDDEPKHPLRVVCDGDCRYTSAPIMRYGDLPPGWTEEQSDPFSKDRGRKLQFCPKCSTKRREER